MQPAIILEGKSPCWLALAPNGILYLLRERHRRFPYCTYSLTWIC